MAVINFANEVMVDRPIGFWRLGDPPGSMTAADSSVNPITGTLNGNNGICSPSGITFGQPGLYGGDTAALFDGLTGLIVVPDSLEFNVPYITIEAKVRWNGWSEAADKLVGTGYLATTHPREIRLGWPRKRAIQFDHIRESPRRVPLQVEIRTSPHGNTIPGAQTPPGVVLQGAETHVVATYDGESIKIYVTR